MQPNRRLLIISFLVTLLALGGCSTTSEPETGAGTSPSQGESGATTSGYQGGQGYEGQQTAETGAATAGGQWSGSPLDDPSSPLYEKMFFFDFDSSEIRPEYLPALRAHAEYLIANPDQRVVIEGHCDERGSREYNMALGERRANAVRRFLEAEGVDPAQLETVSYGEEKPLDPRHNEEAWSVNRRAVLVYQ